MASLHQTTWKRAGIHEAIINSTFEFKRKTNLVYGLSEKWCCETNTFIFPWGEATNVIGGYDGFGRLLGFGRLCFQFT
ncbi:putative aminotransferase-like, plant mobile domain-containing protein [Rosa chinensis]|uniref:Putative aminotransferase-like, plant mobile domain-containing protein n=1 Tax=Rosa chinensis TaxID=74649 RepID=A0A2P6QBZ8_ROSCH|nr:putative aminotransferase-like, plant mobile domain-containing protein [Rosa chinensis]